MTQEKEVELLTVQDKWDIPYAYSAGETVSKFLVELRDNARILATKCPKCQRVVIERLGYNISRNEVRNGKCPDCGTDIAGVYINT